jgi:hypothetical protein
VAQTLHSHFNPDELVWSQANRDCNGNLDKVESAMEAVKMMEQSFKQICSFVLVQWLQIKGYRVLHKITYIAIFWDFSEEILWTENKQTKKKTTSVI